MVGGAVSVDIGCVRMTERHLRSDPPTPAEVAAARADIGAALDVVAAKIAVADARTLVGLAGSVTTVAALALGLDAYDAGRIHHARIGAGQVQEQTARLLAMPQAERARLGVMHPGRVDVIGGGALVLEAIMTRFGFAEVLVSEHDILDGIAWSLAAAAPGDGPEPVTGRGPAVRPARAGPEARPATGRCLRGPAGRMIPRPPPPRSPATRRRCVLSPPGQAPWPSWWPGSPSAGPARGWSNGGSRWPPSNGRHRAANGTGAVPSPAGATSGQRC